MHLTALATNPAELRRTDLFIGHSSHILLASTLEHQEAYETDDGEGGVFTEALLDVLKGAEGGGDLREMTYQTLVDKIKERFQGRMENQILRDGTTRPISL